MAALYQYFVHGSWERGRDGGREDRSLRGRDKEGAGWGLCTKAFSRVLTM